jgi:hypothetical protein
MSLVLNGTGIEVPEEALPALRSRFEEDAQNLALAAQDTTTHPDDRECHVRDAAIAARVAEGLGTGGDVEMTPADVPYVRAALQEDTGSVLCGLWAREDFAGLMGVCELLLALDAVMAAQEVAEAA